MKITVIGAGYVGLTTAACFAQIGHDVFCSESDFEKLGKLRAGVMPIYEPHLEPIVAAAVANGKLVFGGTEEGIDHGEVIFICVGTPPLPNGDADLSAIERLARDIAKRAKGYRLVVEKSTVPVLTGSQLRKHISNHSSKSLECDVASNPEFLREGSSIYDLLHPDRIVVGTDTAKATEILREIYAPIIEGRFKCPLHANCENCNKVRFLVTDTNSAELIKHASNSFLAMKISFINMVADLCEAVGADISMVAEGMGLDPRIGAAFLNPGIGFGGFCFPKDVQAFRRIGEKNGCDFTLLQAVEDINKARIKLFLDKLREELWVINGKKIAVWGLAFKPNTDDIRFAPAMALIQELQREGAIISAYDPQAMDKAKASIPDIRYCSSPYEASKSADAILIATEWDEFRGIDWLRVAAVVDRPLILDGRNVLNQAEIAQHGFHYVGIGKAPLAKASATARV
jgi:UDPglucose 6-dehydrogenase